MVTIPGSGLTLSAFNSSRVFVAGENINLNDSDTVIPTVAAMRDYVDNSDDIFIHLNSAHAGANATGAQDLFPLDVTLEANTVYEYELRYALNKTAGATSHTYATLFGGSATLNNILRNIQVGGNASAATSNTTLLYHGYLTVATSTVITAAIVAAAANIWVHETGTISVNTGGTFIPQYALSVAPGGAYSTVVGSFMRLQKLGASGSNLSKGSWA